MVMSMDPTLCLGVAFDNFDRSVETSSGKNCQWNCIPGCISQR